VIESEFEPFHVFFSDVLRSCGVGHFLEKRHGFLHGQCVRIIVKTKKQLCNDVFHNLRIHKEFEDITIRANETFDRNRFHCFKKLHFFFLTSLFVFLPFNRVLTAIVFFIVFLAKRGRIVLSVLHLLVFGPWLFCMHRSGTSLK